MDDSLRSSALGAREVCTCSTLSRKSDTTLLWSNVRLTKESSPYDLAAAPSMLVVKSPQLPPKSVTREQKSFHGAGVEGQSYVSREKMDL